jgi:hypothetical protein
MLWLPQPCVIEHVVARCPEGGRVSGADNLIPVLYKYYMTMSLARQEFYSYLNKPDGVPRPDADDAQNGMEFLFSKAGIMMSYWYGMLWVVIDGWEQTGLSDSEIEELLKSPGKRKQLSDFRNSLFHFQKELLPAKQQPLFADRSFVSWVTALSDAFKNHLIAEMRRISAKT